MPQDATNMGNGMGNDMSGMDDNEIGGDDLDIDMDGDEELDPKKEIQKLTGKLSQSLRKYNDEQSEPDSELNKYVAGMLSKQFSKALSKEDKDEVIKKINSNSETEEMPDDEETLQDGTLDMQDQNPMEAKRNVGKMIKEISNSTVNDDSDEKRKEKKSMIKTNRKSPFLSNR